MSFLRSLYAIGGGDFVKVGIAVRPHMRLATLKTSSPYPLRIMHECEVLAGHAAKLEKMVHRALARYRSHGEWFKAAPEVVIAAIDEIAGPHRVEPIMVGKHWHIIRTPKPDRNDAMAVIRRGLEVDRYKLDCECGQVKVVTLALKCLKCERDGKVTLEMRDYPLRTKFKCTGCGAKL